MKKVDIVKNGIIKENPVLRLILGCCPVLAVTTAASNGIGMGVAATIVLIGSNFVVSLTRKIIPKSVRIPAYIVIIASFVTAVQFLVKAYVPAIDKALGIFLPLIVVNCIILGRAEMFASKNNVVDSVIDAISMGVGFTIVLFVMGSIREVIGGGTWFGMQVFSPDFAIGSFILPPGGFFVFGILIAVANKLTNYKLSNASAGCGSCSGCGNKSEIDIKKEKIINDAKERADEKARVKKELALKKAQEMKAKKELENKNKEEKEINTKTKDDSKEEK